MAHRETDRGPVAMSLRIRHVGWIAAAILVSGAGLGRAADPVRKIAPADLNREYSGVSAPTPAPAPPPAPPSTLVDPGSDSPPGVVLQPPDFQAPGHPEGAPGPIEGAPGPDCPPACGPTCEGGGGCGCCKVVGGICRGAHCVCLKTRNALCNLHYQKMLYMKCGLIKAGACVHNACANVECCTSKVINGMFDP